MPAVACVSCHHTMLLGLSSAPSCFCVACLAVQILPELLQMAIWCVPYWVAEAHHSSKFDSWQEEVKQARSMAKMSRMSKNASRQSLASLATSEDIVVDIETGKGKAAAKGGAQGEQLAHRSLQLGRSTADSETDSGACSPERQPGGHARASSPADLAPASTQL